MKTTIIYVAIIAILFAAYCSKEANKPAEDTILRRTPECTLDMLGFANYCLELDVPEPDTLDVAKYIKQGGYKYYSKHIENANQ